MGSLWNSPPALPPRPATDSPSTSTPPPVSANPHDDDSNSNPWATPTPPTRSDTFQWGNRSSSFTHPTSGYAIPETQTSTTTPPQLPAREAQTGGGRQTIPTQRPVLDHPVLQPHSTGPSSYWPSASQTPTRPTFSPSQSQSPPLTRTSTNPFLDPVPSPSPHQSARTSPLPHISTAFPPSPNNPSHFVLSPQAGSSMTTTPPLLGGDPVHHRGLAEREAAHGEKGIESEVGRKVRELVERGWKEMEVELRDRIDPQKHPKDFPRPLTPSPEPTDNEHDNDDPATATFLATFPALPSSPSRSPSPSPSPSQSPSSAQSILISLLLDLLKSQNNSATIISLESKVAAEITRSATIQSQLTTSIALSGALEARLNEQVLRADTAEKEVEKRMGWDKEMVLMGNKVLELRKEMEGVKTEKERGEKAHAENLENATTHAEWLQERINVLEGEMESNERGREREEEADGDNIWREIVDRQHEILSDHTKTLATLTSSLTCSICSDLLTNATTLSCGHSGCIECFESWFARGNNNCPECRKEGVAGVLSPAWALRDCVRELKGIGLGEED